MASQVNEDDIHPMWSAVDAFDSDLVLTEFLFEMDELDHLQEPILALVHTKHQQSGNTVEPSPKKMKITSPSESSSTHQQVHTKTKPLPGKRRNTSWLRRKQEIQALRGESSTLESHLANLQTQQAHSTSLRSSKVLTEGEEQWKSVAAIARQRRQHAQSENTRLRTQLRVYSNTADMLHSQLTHAILQQQKLFESCTRAMHVGSIARQPLQLDGSNEVFDALESKMNARLHELDIIVRETCQSLSEDDAEDMRICREDGLEAGPTVEFKYARSFPYGENMTASTIWEVIEVGGVVANKADSCVVRRSADVVATTFRYSMPFSRCDTVGVDTYTVVRRFTTSIGLVVLIQSSSEWSIPHKTGSIWRHSTEEAGWAVVREHPSVEWCSTDGEAQRASQVRTMIKLRPNESDNNGGSPTRSTFTGTVGDIVIPSFREILSSHHQFFENLLFDSARGSRTGN